MEDDSDYFCIITSSSVDDNGNLIVWGFQSEDFLKLSETFKEIVATYEALQIIEPGTPCAALYMPDQNWYRAIILYQYSNSRWVLRFTNFGEEQVVHEINLRAIPDLQTKVENSALAFQLTPNLNPIGNSGTWTSHAAQLICSHYSFKKVKVRIESTVSSREYVAYIEEISSLLIRNNLCVLGVNYLKEHFPLEKSFTAHVTFISGSTVHFQEKTAHEINNRLTNDLNVYFGVELNRKPALICKGVVVACLSEERNRICRGRVCKLFKNSCEVYYIDYGDLAKKKLKEVWHLPAVFQDHRYSAVPSRVENFNNLDGFEPQDLHDFLTKEQTVTVTVKVKDYFNFSNHQLSVDIESISELGAGETNQTTFKMISSSQIDSVFGMFTRLEVGYNHQAKVIVGNVLSVDKIFAQILNNTPELQKFETKLSTLYLPLKEQSELTSGLKQGDVCAIKTDHYFLRAVIFSISAQQAIVGLLDYGLSKRCCRYEDLYQPIHEFFELPLQTLVCSMARISPLANSKLLKLFSILSSQVLVAIFFPRPNESHLVEFYEGLRNLNNSFGVSFGSLAEKKPLATYTPVKPMMMFQPLLTDIELNIQSCMSFEGMEVSLSSSDFPINEICVTNIQGPSGIWIQSKSIKEEFEDFQALINHTQQLLQSPIMLVSFNQFCCVWNSDLKSWCRARLFNCVDTVATVRLIDYGQLVKLQASKITILDDSLKLRSPYTIKCKLFNVTPVISQWDEDCNKVTKEVIERAHKLYGRVITNPEKTGKELILVCSTSDGFVNLSAFLVQNKYAKWYNSKLINSPKPSVDLSERAPSVDEEIIKINYSMSAGDMLGESFFVELGCFRSPSDFYLIKQNTFYSNCQILGQNLAISCKNLVGEDCCQKMYKGMPCKILNKDIWCRCSLIDFSDLNKCHLLLVDFGKEVFVNIKDIFLIDDEDVLYPEPAAFRCILIKSLNSSENICTKELLQEHFNLNSNAYCSILSYTRDSLGVRFICDLQFYRRPSERLKSSEIPQLEKIPFKLYAFLQLPARVYIEKKYDFYICSVDALHGLFYCQLRCHSDQIKSLQNDLQAAVLGKPHHDQLPTTICCVVLRDDGFWYRGHLLSPICGKSENKVCVQLVDYGMVIETSFSNLRFDCVDQFTHIPSMAFPCQFSDDFWNRVLQRSKYSRSLCKVIENQEMNGLVVGRNDGIILLDLGLDASDTCKQLRSCLGFEFSLWRNHVSQDYFSAIRFLYQLNVCENVHQDEIISVIMKAKFNSLYFVYIESLEKTRESSLLELTGFYDALRYCDYCLGSIYKDQVVCVRCQASWCRAIVCEIKNDDYVVVQDLDSGVVFKTQKDQMKYLIDHDLATFPCYAIKCTTEENFELSDINFVQSHSQQSSYQRLQLRFLRYNEMNQVWVVDNVSENQPVRIWQGLAVDSMVLDTDDSLPVHISHVDSANCFYLQLLWNIPELEEMEDNINRSFVKNHLNWLIQPGDFCLCFCSSSRKFRRAQVLSVDSTDSLRLLYIDYGSKTVAPTSSLTQLPAKFTRGAFAAKCNLEEGLDVSTTELRVLSSCDNLLIYAVMSDNDSNSSYIKLEVFIDRYSIPLQEYIIRNRQGQFNIPQVTVTNPTNDSNYDKVKGQISLKLEGQTSLSLSKVTDSPRLVCIEGADISDNAPEKVKLVAFRSLQDFTVQLDKNASTLKKIICICAEESKNVPLKSFAIHQACLAKSDQMWCRAEIVGVQSGTATVYFVDYGEEKKVKLKDLKQLSLAASSLPRLAFRCKVENCPSDALTRDFVHKSLAANPFYILYTGQRLGANTFIVNVFYNIIQTFKDFGMHLANKGTVLSENRLNPTNQALNNLPCYKTSTPLTEVHKSLFDDEMIPLVKNRCSSIKKLKKISNLHGPIKLGGSSEFVSNSSSKSPSLVCIPSTDSEKENQQIKEKFLKSPKWEVQSIDETMES